MKKLTNQDFIEAAALLNCEVAAIRAVAEVESRGDGFYSDGFPVILFERHKFFKYTDGSFAGDYPEICNRAAGGYGKPGANQRRKFDLAFSLDPVAALKSCSWGKFQIMGFNHKVCGFNSVNDFVEAMKRSEGEQLKAFCRFVIGSNLAGHLRSKNWARFASGYNGADYKKNKYDVKMANAYARFSKEKIRAFAGLPAVSAGNDVTAESVSTTPPVSEIGSKADDSDFLTSALDKNVSPEQIKTALPSLGSRVWKFLIRPLSFIYAALEAGNIYAWLGIIVAAAAAVWLIYLHRADIRKLIEKIKTKITS